MCGIAGLIHKGKSANVGGEMQNMLQSLKHRGPDSTGYALYGDRDSTDYILRFKVGENVKEGSSAVMEDESIYEKRDKNVDSKGKINIEIRGDSDYIYVAITDNGVGFDHVDKTRMLTPYFTTKKKGTGLGLAVVTKIISDHNSTILFSSIENGAKVEIKLPKEL